MHREKPMYREQRTYWCSCSGEARLLVEEVSMKGFGSSAKVGVAVFAVMMSVVWALFVPYGNPWASFAWAVLACAAAVLVARGSGGPTPSMSDVIHRVEGELSQAPAAVERGVVPTRAAL
jgi:hypothetical protein